MLTTHHLALHKTDTLALKVQNEFTSGISGGKAFQSHCSWEEGHPSYVCPAADGLECSVVVLFFSIRTCHMVGICRG